MADEDNNRDTPAECMFDITKPSEQVEFLGFIDGLVGSANNPSGLFEWTCGTCGASNHDAVVIEPNQSFLAEWSCNHCDEAVLVRFRARPITDWIAQHALAITGRALCGLAEKEAASENLPCRQGQSTRSGQKMFAWIAVPLLTVLIILGSMDMERIRASSAYPHIVSGRHSSPSYSWLGGYWISANSNDVLYFGYMNPVARCGAYTRPAKNGRPAQIVRFEILHEETTDDRLVLRELNESSPADSSQAIIYLTRDEDTMVRMTTSRGESALTTYYHTAKPSER